MKTCAVVLCIVFVAGCTPTESYTPPTRTNSDVMSESDRSFVVDHMVGQGADRSEAEAFTKALNDAQREWEANNR